MFDTLFDKITDTYYNIYLYIVKNLISVLKICVIYVSNNMFFNIRKIFK